MAPRRQGSHPQSASLNCRLGSPVRNPCSRPSPPHDTPFGAPDKAQALALPGQGASMSVNVSVKGPLAELERGREPLGGGGRGEESKWRMALDEQPPMSPEAALFDSLDHSGWRDIPLDDDDDSLDAAGAPPGGPGGSGVDGRGKAGHAAEQEASLLFLMQLQRCGRASPSPSPSPSPSASFPLSPAHFGLQPLTHSASEPPLSMQHRADAEGEGDQRSPFTGSHLTLSRSADHRKGAHALALTSSMWLTDRSTPGARASDANMGAPVLAAAPGPSSAPLGSLSAWDFRMGGGSEGREEPRRWYEAGDEEEEGCTMMLQSPTSTSAMELDPATATASPFPSAAAATVPASAPPVPAALSFSTRPLEGDAPAAEERPQGQGGDAWLPAPPAAQASASAPPAARQGVAGLGQGFWACAATSVVPGPVLQPEQGAGGESQGGESKAGEGREEAMDEAEPAPGVPRGRPRTPRPRQRQGLSSGVWGVASGTGSKEAVTGRRKDSLLPTIHEGSAVLAPQRLVPSQPLEAQLSPSLAALLSVLSTDYDTERPKPSPLGSTHGGTASTSTSTTSSSSTHSGSTGASGSRSASSGSGGSGSGSNRAPGSKSVPHSPKSTGLANRQLEATPSLSALLSILSVESEAEGSCPPKTRALLKSMATIAAERELDLEFECGGLARQCSLDSGIHWLERKGASPSLEPSPSGSLHSSPSQSPLRTHNSSLNSTPSPVLQRRLTGNRVSVYEECWQAGPQRKDAEAESPSLRSVCEVLETEGTAAFYRGFKLEAPPNGRGMKRTKVQDA